MFEVYAKEIELEIDGRKNKYKLYPLSGESLPILFEVITELNFGKDATEEEMLKSLSGNGNIKKLHKLIYDTL